jgi:hypothetical protein
MWGLQSRPCERSCCSRLAPGAVFYQSSSVSRSN